MAIRPKKRKDEHLHIRARAEQIRRWKRAADKDQRTLSQWVAVILDAEASAVEGE